MKITYDPEKRALTLADRGLDFEDARVVMAGPKLTLEDIRFDYPEDRFVTYGLLNERLVMFAWTPTEDGMRVISMRKCHDKEYRKVAPEWDDPDLPEWTEEEIDRAEFSIGNRVIRVATGTLTRAGRPPQGDVPKRQVTLRLDPDVIDAFRAGGAGWQSRMNTALRKAVGL